MAIADIIRNLQVLVIILASHIGQVWSEYCRTNLNCYFPEKCCSNGMTCCYDNDRDDHFISYKLHVWNMWYFWFIIIFIMMSCFGGCGYYRRKRMAAITRMQQQQHRSDGVNISVDYDIRRNRHRSHNNHQPNYMAYTGPGLETDSTFLPPPYSEVVSQPDMYPPNKSNLPPYPGAPVITADNTGGLYPGAPVITADNTGGLYPGAPVITADNTEMGNSSLALNVQDLNSQIPQPPTYSEVISMSQNTSNQRSTSSETNQSQAAADPAEQTTQNNA